MGLLDEAIREHLDLKRRHGADPAEIERAEQEALGPVRRGPVDPAELPPEPAAPAGDEPEHGDQEFAADEQAHDDVGQEPRGFQEPSGIDERSRSTPGADLDEDETMVPTEEQEALPAGDEEPSGPEQSGRVERPADEPEASRPGPVTHPGEETAEFDTELEGQRDKPREDVLEETPEFLQDAPDHDRLWFEQRPPRDFDFDG